MPHTIHNQFRAEVALTAQPRPGEWQIGMAEITCDATDRFSALSLGAMPATCLIERPVPLHPNQPVRLQVLVDDTALVVYIDHTVALCCRLYNHRRGDSGCFVSEGQARFGNTSLRTMEGDFRLSSG